MSNNKKYRADVFVNDEFFGDENNTTHIIEYCDTIPECHLFIIGFENIAKSAFILEKKIDNLYDIIQQVF